MSFMITFPDGGMIALAGNSAELDAQRIGSSSCQDALATSIPSIDHCAATSTQKHRSAAYCVKVRVSGN
jgi:hypothetical protein